VEQVYSLAQSLPVIPILFGLAFVLYWIYTLIIMYHLVRFGIGSKPKILALIFFMGSLVLFTNMILAFSQVNLTLDTFQLGEPDFFDSFKY